MIATWPSSLPPPQRDSWQLQPQDARRKRQSEAGPPAYRRRFSSVAQSVSMAVKLTHDQRAVFDSFYYETCQHGSIRFWMPDWGNDGWPLTTKSGEPLDVNAETGETLTISARWLCAWGDQLPSESMVDQVRFLKSFQIWVLP